MAPVGLRPDSPLKPLRTLAATVHRWRAVVSRPPGPGLQAGVAASHGARISHGGIVMRTQIVDEEVLARATEAAEQERGSKLKQVSKERLCHRAAMRALERKREIEELRRNLSDFEDYWLDES